MNKLKNLNFGPAVSIFTILFISALSFYSGSLWQSSKTGSGTNNVLGKAAPTQKAAAGALVKPQNSDHIRGNKSAKIALVEYSDLDCPYCVRFHETMNQAMKDYGDKIIWVFRHFPLDSLHPEARKKAEASECVAELGGNDKFWEFTDEVYATKPKLADLPGVVSDMGLDSNKFTECLASGKYASKVQASADEGAKSGVSGTPGDFLLEVSSGQSVALGGAIPYEQLKQMLDSALQQ